MKDNLFDLIALFEDNVASAYCHRIGITIELQSAWALGIYPSAPRIVHIFRLSYLL